MTKRRGGAKMLLALLGATFCWRCQMAIAQSASDKDLSDAKFEEACRGAGTRFFASPEKKISTIYADWGHVNPETLNEDFVLDANGKIAKNFDAYPAWEMQVNSPDADALVTVDVTNRDEVSRRITPEQRAMRYTLTVTERRSGRKLATYAFAIDRENKRACGANANGMINVDTFLRRATAMPGMSYDPPTPKHIRPEIIEDEKYDSDKIVKPGEAYQKEWQFFIQEVQTCNNTVLPLTNRLSGESMFADDPLHHIARDIGAATLCRPDGVWIIKDVGGDNGAFQLKKYTRDGKLLFFIAIDKADYFFRYPATILASTFAEHNGSMTFVLQNAKEDNMTSALHISRRLKVTVKEMADQN